MTHLPGIALGAVVCVIVKVCHLPEETWKKEDLHPVYFAFVIVLICNLLLLDTVYALVINKYINKLYKKYTVVDWDMHAGASYGIHLMYIYSDIK